MISAEGANCSGSPGLRPFLFQEAVKKIRQAQRALGRDVGGAFALSVSFLGGCSLDSTLHIPWIYHVSHV